MRQICQRIRVLNFVKGRGYGIDDDWGGNVAGDRGGRRILCIAAQGDRGTASVPSRVHYCARFLFASARVVTPATPSALTRHCLAAARSRRGSDMPPACHSLPRRRFATLKGAALRGKDLGLAQLSSAPPLSRFPYRRIKTAPMLLSMGAVLPGIQGAFFLGAEVCVLR